MSLLLTQKKSEASGSHLTEHGVGEPHLRGQLTVTPATNDENTSGLLFISSALT